MLSRVMTAARILRPINAFVARSIVRCLKSICVTRLQCCAYVVLMCLSCSFVAGQCDRTYAFYSGPLGFVLVFYAPKLNCYCVEVDRQG